MDNIIYRKVQPPESKQYRSIRLESLQNYSNSYGSNYEQEHTKPKLAFEQYIETSNPENFIIGAFDIDQLIGICGFFKQKDNRFKHRGGIIQMYVKAGYQNKGIGFALLKETVNTAFNIEGLEQIELGVMSNVASARKIYVKMGFVEVGLQKHFLKHNNEYFHHSLMIIHRKDYDSN